jgi:hypothetical protein
MGISHGVFLRMNCWVGSSMFMLSLDSRDRIWRAWCSALSNMALWPAIIRAEMAREPW